MAWMPGHQRPTKSRIGRRSGPSQTRLGFESLEPRMLLATAEFMVNLYHDDHGSLGARISDDIVEVGDSFFLEITAREYDPDFAGLAGVSLDIAWDPTILREVDATFDPSDPNSNLITPSFPLYRHGWLDNDAGTIDDLSATASKFLGVGRAIGDLQPERFSLLRFQAIQPAESSPFTMEQGRSRIATSPVSSLGPNQLRFEPQTITVKRSPPASAAPDKTVAPVEATSATLPPPVEPNSPPVEIAAANTAPLPLPSALSAAVAAPFVQSQPVCHPEPRGATDGEADGEAPEAMASTLVDDVVATPLADFAPAMSSDSDADDNLAFAYGPVPSSTDAAEASPSSRFEGTTFQPLVTVPGFGPPLGLAFAAAKVAETPPGDWLCKNATRSLAAYASNVDDLLGRSDFDLSAL